MLRPSHFTRRTGPDRTGAAFFFQRSAAAPSATILTTWYMAQFPAAPLLAPLPRFRFANPRRPYATLPRTLRPFACCMNARPWRDSWMNADVVAIAHPFASSCRRQKSASF